MEDSISRDIALRIALAARALPDMEAAHFVSLLLDMVGAPLTEEKLASLKVKDFKTVNEGELANIPPETLKEALRLLQGEVEAEQLPEIEAFEPDPKALKIAVASNTGEELDGHFGSCSRFLVYMVTAETIKLIAIRSANPESPPEDKNAYRTELIKDCNVLYVASIGGPAAAKVVKADIHPIKRPEQGNARVILEDLKQRLINNPPPWLAKIMGIEAKDRAHITVGEEDNEDSA